jgi:hypothetical protein
MVAGTRPWLDLRTPHTFASLLVSPEETVLTTLDIHGFDSAGEPQTRHGEGGTLEIMFNFMPPLNGADDPNPHVVFETFEVVLAAALGVPVIRDDRELFIIPHPQPDTAARAKAYLETFWTAAWPKLWTAAP